MESDKLLKATFNEKPKSQPRLMDRAETSRAILADGDRREFTNSTASKVMAADRIVMQMRPDD